MFKKPSLLKSHQTVHNGLRPYPCQVIFEHSTLKWLLFLVSLFQCSFPDATGALELFLNFADTKSITKTREITSVRFVKKLIYERVSALHCYKASFLNECTYSKRKKSLLRSLTWAEPESTFPGALPQEKKLSPVRAK